MDGALAFECFMTKAADSGYVWKTGQSVPMMYGAHFEYGTGTRNLYIYC